MQMSPSRRLSVLATVYLLVTCLANFAWAAKDVMDDQKSFSAKELKGDVWVEKPNAKAQMKRFLSQGGQDVGGGNSFEGEFKSIGTFTLGNIRAFSGLETFVSFEKLAKAIDEVRIVIEPSRYFLDGVERHAVNFRSLKVIMVSENYWKQLTLEQKKILVMHEYLRFCDVEDKAYAVSSVLTAFQQLTLIPPAISNIYHKVEFPQNIWNFNEDDVAPVYIDKAQENVRLQFAGYDWPFAIIAIVSDPVIGGKTVFYSTGPSSELTLEENERSKQCARKIVAKTPLTNFIVGERDTTIIDCW
jgi:hypothetical protein